jgi:hypothetical protein
MQSEQYTAAKKAGLRDLLKQMQALMSKGKGDEPIAEGEIEVEAGAEDAPCEQCEGEGCEHCESEESSDEPAEVNAVAEGEGEESEGDESEESEPDFKQEVRDYLAGKGKARKPTKSLVVKPQLPSAGKGKFPFQKGDKKRA